MNYARNATYCARGGERWTHVDAYAWACGARSLEAALGAARAELASTCARSAAEAAVLRHEIAASEAATAVLGAAAGRRALDEPAEPPHPEHVGGDRPPQFMEELLQELQFKHLILQQKQ